MYCMIQTQFAELPKGSSEVEHCATVAMISVQILPKTFLFKKELTTAVRLSA